MSTLYGSWAAQSAFGRTKGQTMNRLTTLGVLLVTLLLPTHAVAQTWTVRTTTDKLTDKKVLTATIRGATTEHPTLNYELTLKCDAGRSVNVTISTFDGAKPRPIPWNVTRTASGGQVHTYSTDPVIVRESVTQSVRYRIDSGAVANGTLVQSHANAGTLSSDIFNTDTRRINSNGALSGAQEQFLARLQGALAGNVAVLTMPTARLIIADLFPGETVEFSFNTLTADQRGAMQNGCGFQSAAAAEEARKAAEVENQRRAAAEAAAAKGRAEVEARNEAARAEERTAEAQKEAQKAAQEEAARIEEAKPPLRVTLGGDIKPPTVLRRPAVPCGQGARLFGWGDVILDVTIRADGTVKDVELLSVIPKNVQSWQDSAFDKGNRTREAYDVLHESKFTPTIVNGVAVPVIMTMSMTFSRECDRTFPGGSGLLKPR